jgi:hypothetical protein
MKTAHFTAYNGSGMNSVAETCVAAERAIGIDAHLINIQRESDWSRAFDADVHIAHTHWPDFYQGKSFRRRLTKEPKIVTLFHGTPEFVVRDTMGAHRHNPKHGLGDGIMMLMHWLQKSDARITFWPRHQAIYQSMVDRGSEVHCLPMGVDRAFWAKGQRNGDWPGNPSVWTGENPHIIKDPLDLILMWPWIYPQLEGGSLHVCYLAENIHRTFAPLINRLDAGYAMHWSAFTFSHPKLRDVFKSIDFFVGLVRYGDHNRVQLEASAAGARTISYRGNPYTDYWITEGDQRVMAMEMLSILRGDVAPRKDKSPVPDMEETARGMQDVYKSVLARTHVPGFSLPFAPCKVWAPEPVTIDLRTPEVKDSAAASAAESGSVAAREAVALGNRIGRSIQRQEQQVKRSRLSRPRRQTSSRRSSTSSRKPSRTPSRKTTRPASRKPARTSAKRKR